MLVYHPALDCFHCAFRTLVLCEIVEHQFEVDKGRILDFFMTFPHLIAQMRLPNALRSVRARAKVFKPPFEFLGAPKLVIRSMGPIQLAAYASLSATGHLDSAAFKAGLIQRRDPVSDTTLLAAIQRYREERADLLEILKQLEKMPLSGEEGIKARSGLLEYRYDSI